MPERSKPVIPVAISVPAPPPAVHTTVSITRAGKSRRVLLVPVMINGKGPFQFILDTGAPTTVLSKRFADSQHIGAQSHATGIGAAGEVSASITELDSVQVGDAHRESLEAGVVANFDEIHRRIPDAAGALGLDFLRNYTVIIDYAHDTVTLAEDVHLPAGDESLPFEIGAVLFTEVKINGYGPFPFAIDTGATENALDPVIATKLNLPVRRVGSLRGAGGNGIGTGQLAEFTSLQAGPYSQHEGLIFVADIFPPLRAATNHDLVGIIGYPFFGDGKVTFDFPNSRLSIVK
jgi:predicted aspartyl protease